MAPRLPVASTLPATYTDRLRRAIERNPADYALLPSETPASYAERVAALMLAHVIRAGAKSINLSPVLRGALSAHGYAATYAGLEMARNAGALAVPVSGGLSS